MSYDIRYYQTATGGLPFWLWLKKLDDRQARYRVYFSRPGERRILILCAGDKRTQQKDIERAKAYFKDYKARATPQQSRLST